MRMETLRGHTTVIVRCFLRRVCFVVLAREYFTRGWVSEEEDQVKEAFKQYFWHSLVTFDGELNKWLGLPVVPAQWMCEQPDWEEVYRARVQGLPSEQVLLRT